MTFAFKLFLTTSFVLLLSLFVEGLINALALIELNRNRGRYWDENTGKMMIRDFEMESLEYLDKIDDWYPNGRWINSLSNKAVETGCHQRSRKMRE